VQWFINSSKDEGLRPDYIEDHGDVFTTTMINLYREYQKQCKRSGLVDFGELLLRSHELWLEKPELRGHYQSRFRHMLVDEFQDTNAVQYAWLRVLSGDRVPMTIVGDDDQSIYGWRGARIENIQQFQQDFGSSRLVRLEQNYRSTQTILSAANAVIENNQGRLGRNSGPTARPASPSTSIPPSTSWMGPTTSPIPSAPGPSRATRAPNVPSSTAPTPSHGCWRSRCCARTFRTASTVACASSTTARKSATPWPTCAWSTTATTTPPSSAW